LRSIIISSWERSDSNLLLGEVFKGKVKLEVTITLVDETIDDEDILGVSPKSVSCCSQLTLVIAWIKNGENS